MVRRRRYTSARPSRLARDCGWHCQGSGPAAASWSGGASWHEGGDSRARYPGRDSNPGPAGVRAHTAPWWRAMATRCRRGDPAAVRAWRWPARIWRAGTVARGEPQEHVEIARSGAVPTQLVVRAVEQRPRAAVGIWYGPIREFAFERLQDVFRAWHECRADECGELVE